MLGTESNPYNSTTPKRSHYNRNKEVAYEHARALEGVETTVKPGSRDKHG